MKTINVTVFPVVIGKLFGYSAIEWYGDYVKIVYADGKKLIDTIANGEKLLAEFGGLV